LLKNYVFRFRIAVFAVVSIFLCFSAISTKPVSASGGSIAMANYYPNNGGTYGFIDHFLMQTTAVNTNTTLSVSIDGGPLTPMTYQGIITETVPSDTVVRNWYTWQAAIPALTAPGRHTFQFFEHYYVWQDKDQYWAEFNAYSTVKSFTIALPPPTPSKSTSTSNPYAAPSSQASHLELQSSLFSPMETLHTTATAIAIISIVAVAAMLRKRTRSIRKLDGQTKNSSFTTLFVPNSVLARVVVPKLVLSGFYSSFGVYGRNSA